MFRRKSDAAAVGESVPKPAVNRAWMRNSPATRGDEQMDVELMDTTVLEKNEPLLVPVANLKPKKRPARKDRKPATGGAKKRVERGRARTREDPEHSSAQKAEKKKKKKSSKQVTDKDMRMEAKVSDEDPNLASSNSEKRRLRSKRNALRNPKIRSEIDKLYDLIRQSAKPGEEEPSMHDIEKSLLKTLPKRKGSRRNKTSKMSKGAQTVSRRKMAVHIGSTSSDSLALESHEAPKKPTISRRLKKALSGSSEKTSPIFSFDRVASSNSANSSVLQDPTVRDDEEQEHPSDPFVLWNCGAPTSVEASSVRGESSQCSTNVHGRTPQPDAIECPHEDKVNNDTNVANASCDDRPTGTGGDDSEAKHRNTLFQKLFKGLRSASPKAGSRIKACGKALDTESSNQQTKAPDAIQTGQEDAGHEERKMPEAIPEMTMLVSMSSPNQAAATSTIPIDEPQVGGTEAEETAQAEEKSESSSIFGFLDIFGDAFYRTVSKLEPYPVPTKPIPSVYDIMSDFSNATDLVSPVVSPRNGELNECRENDVEDERVGITTAEAREQPPVPSVPSEEKFEDKSSVRSALRKCDQTALANRKSLERPASKQETVAKDSDRPVGEASAGAFRESYVLGYLLGSLAVQGEEEKSDKTVNEVDEQIKGNQDELGLEHYQEGAEKVVGILEEPHGERDALVDETNIATSTIKGEQISQSRSASGLTKRILFGAGRAKRNETKAQSLAKKTKAMKPWLKSSAAKTLPPLCEEEMKRSNTHGSNVTAATSQQAHQEVEIESSTPNESIIPLHRSPALDASLLSAAMPLDDILRMVKTQAPPRLAKGFLTYVLATFAAQTKTVDRDGLCKGYIRCIAESKPATGRPYGPELPPAMKLATIPESPVEPFADDFDVTMPYELALAPTSYSFGCFRLNCTPCVHPEPDISHMPDEDLEAIITTVESSLAQMTDIPAKSSSLPLMSDISLSSEESDSWSSDDDDEGDEDLDEFDTDGETYISDSDVDDLSSGSFSDVADWMEFLAGSFESSSGSENSAFDRLASFDVTEWMLRE